ncbi:MAG: hypothetical protein QOI11_2847, partial [Candidatus Eremiobacteraeota bacterium]|nr:hypothetical protein [Candidatus Eremiobacteraeota bacterium]
RLGDPGAVAVVTAAAAALAGLAARAIARLGAGEEPVPVALAGGAFANEAFFARTAELLAPAAPRALAVRPRYEPVLGAALLAFAEAGLPPPAQLVER